MKPVLPALCLKCSYRSPVGASTCYLVVISSLENSRDLSIVLKMPSVIEEFTFDWVPIYTRGVIRKEFGEERP